MPPQISATGPSPSARAGAENPTTSQGKIVGLPPAFVLRQNPDQFPRARQRYARLDGMSETQASDWRQPPANPGFVNQALLVAGATDLPITDAGLRLMGTLPPSVQAGILDDLRAVTHPIDDNDIERRATGFVTVAQNPGTRTIRDPRFAADINDPPPATLSEMEAELSELEETEGEGDHVYDALVGQFRDALEAKDMNRLIEIYNTFNSENTRFPAPGQILGEPNLPTDFFPAYQAEPFDYGQLDPTGEETESPYGP